MTSDAGFNKQLHHLAQRVAAQILLADERKLFGERPGMSSNHSTRLPEALVRSYGSVAAPSCMRAQVL